MIIKVDLTDEEIAGIVGHVMGKENDQYDQDSRKAEPRCDPDQLVLLKKCSEKRDITEWNQCRKENEKVEIWLQGVNLSEAHLEGADLFRAHLGGANLGKALLEEVDLGEAYLEGANLWSAHLEGAYLHMAHLEKAHLWDAHLEGASLAYAHLEGANFTFAHLEDANFTASIVDGLTLFWSCEIDRNTDFKGVGLESCRIDEQTKYLLEYNRRRMNCEKWYIGNSFWLMIPRQIITSPVRLFLWMSDYGQSTLRILATFFVLAVIFAILYWKMPDCVLVNGVVGGLRNFLHALYFSVVTMTTLGFGDISANPESSLGQMLLMLQVLLGYVLLGALVTRFGVLFKSGVVLCQFAKRYKKPKSRNKNK